MLAYNSFFAFPVFFLPEQHTKIPLQLEGDSVMRRVPQYVTLVD